MAVTRSTMMLDEVTDFLASGPTPQEIITFKPSETLERRALELLQRNREGRLETHERAEFEEFMHMDHFMTLLKAKARLKLAGDA